MQTLMKNGLRSTLQMCGECDLYGIHNYTPSNYLNIYVDVLVDYLINKKESVLISKDCENDLLNILRQHGVCADVWDMEKVSNAFIVCANYDEASKLVDLGFHWKSDFIVCGVFKQGYIYNKDRQKMLKHIRSKEQTGNLIIYGAGRNAVLLMKTYQFVPRYIIDTYKIGTFMGYELQCCVEFQDDDLVLISPDFADEIERELSEKNVNWISGKLLL